MNTEPTFTRRQSLRPLWLALILLAASFLGGCLWQIGLPLIGSAFLMGAVGVLALMGMSESKLLTFPIGIAAALIPFFVIGGNVLFLCLGGTVLILAGVLAYCIKNKMPKSSAAVSLTVALLLCGLASVFILLAASGQELTPKALLASVNSFFEALKNDLMEAVRRILEGLTEEQKSYYAEYGIKAEDLQKMPLQVSSAIVDTVKSMAPGLVIALSELLAYLAVCFFVFAVKGTRLYALLPEPKWALFPTQVTCILFMITVLLYFVTSFFPAVNAFSLVVINLMLVLVPSMAACGIRGFVVRLRHPLLKRRAVFFLILFSIFTIFTVGIVLPFVFMLLAFLGAWDVSSLRMAESMSRNKKE